MYTKLKPIGVVVILRLHTQLFPLKEFFLFQVWSSV